jgi:hypothetical protein
LKNVLAAIGTLFHLAHLSIPGLSDASIRTTWPLIVARAAVRSPSSDSFLFNGDIGLALISSMIIIPAKLFRADPHSGPHAPPSASATRDGADQIKRAAPQAGGLTRFGGKVLCRCHDAPAASSARSSVAAAVNTLASIAQAATCPRVCCGTRTTYLGRQWSGPAHWACRV